MGTSKNYGSPGTPRWNAVRIGYTNGAIPMDRVSAEVWRAATSENSHLENMIGSDLVYRCHEIVARSNSAIEAYQRFNREAMTSKSSSIITEFAKRAIVQSYRGDENPAASWRSNFVGELTDYFVSRDVAGYYGTGCRNKNINQVLHFRREIREIVGNKINNQHADIKNASDWRGFVAQSLDLLKNKDK